MKTFNEVRQANKEVDEAKSAIVWKVKPPKGQKNIHPDSKWPGMKPGDIKKMNEGLDEAKKLGSRVKITKGRFAGKEGIIRQMDNGKFKGADKSFDIDLDDGKEANGVPGKDIKIVKESVEERKVPKMKGVSIKGSEVTGLRAKDGKLYSAKPLISGGELSYRVEDEFGAFDTIPLKKFAAKFG